MIRSADESPEDVFARRLREVVLDAHRAGVDVEGGWPVLNEDSTLPDWDVVIVELAKPDQ